MGILKIIRKVYDVHCGNHNGPSATFITNSLIVFRDVEFEGVAAKCRLYVYSVYSMLIRVRLSTKIRGKRKVIVRKNGKYPVFQYQTEYLDKNPDYPEINSCGIYILDVESGKITLVATEEDILKYGKGTWSYSERAYRVCQPRSAKSVRNGSYDALGRKGLPCIRCVGVYRFRH